MPRITKLTITFLFLLILTACTARPVEEMSWFMIGKWRAESQETDIHGSYQAEYFVKFINHNKLRFCKDHSPHSFCATFTYELIEDDLYLVENRRAIDGRWWINRRDNDLLICIWNDENCLVFTRDTSLFCWEDFGMLR